MRILVNQYPGVIFLLLILSACSGPRYYTYTPSPGVMPFFKEKGDATAGAALTVVSEDGEKLNSGIQAKGAYAITDHLAITASFSGNKQVEAYSKNWSDGLHNYDSNFIRYNNRITELGAGYFTTLQNRKTTLNIYGGVGFGKNKITDIAQLTDNTYLLSYLNTTVKKYWLQPSVHHITGRRFNIGVATRLTLLDQKKLHTNWNEEQLKARDLDKLGSKMFFYIEPSILMQVAVFPRWLNLDVGFVFCPDVRTDQYGIVDDTRRMRSRSFMFHIGLSADIKKLFK